MESDSQREALLAKVAVQLCGSIKEFDIPTVRQCLKALHVDRPLNDIKMPALSLACSLQEDPR